MTWPWSMPALLRQVVVVRVDEKNESLRGVLWERRGAWLILRDVSLVRPFDPDDETKEAIIEKRIDGEILIHRTNVAFIQVLS